MSEAASPWAWIRLKDLVEDMCLGKMLDKAKNQGTPKPYLGNINVRWFAFDLTELKEMRFEDDEIERFSLRAGDLVVCEGGEPGRASVWSGQTDCMMIQKALHRIRFYPEVYEPRFGMYFLFYGTTTNRFAEFYTGTTIKHLTGTALSDVLFPLPPLPEQHRIVEKIEELFSDLDAGVASLQRARANLKRYRASVLKSAVEGRLTEEWRKEHPQAEDGGILLDRILRERREKWEKDQLQNFNEKGKEPPKNWQSKYEEPAAPDTSELPELPEGWAWASLEAVAFFQNGHAFPSKDYADEGVRLLRPGNLFDDGTVKWTDKNTRCLPEKWENECPGHIVGEHEVVMNLTAQSLKDDFLGRACLTGEGEKCLLNQRLARITPVASVTSRYLLFLLKSRLFREFVKGLNTGSLIQHMFTSQLKDFVSPLPPLAEQEQIVALVEERLSQIDSAERTIDAELIRSKRLRQSILKRAFEGKLIPQDPKDEPASVLLERIKVSREAEQTKKKAKKATKARAK